MRSILDPKLSKGRIREGHFGSDDSMGLTGAYRLNGPRNVQLVVICSTGDPDYGNWEHVSVSTRDRAPNWQEMCWIKDLFWQDEECVVQYHPPKSQYINCHPHTLHMWRPKDGIFSQPPAILVGHK